MIKTLLNYDKKQQKNFYLSLLLILLASVASIFAYVFAYFIIKGLIDGAMPLDLLTYALYICGFMFLRSVLMSIGLKCSHFFAYNTLGEIRKDLTKKMAINPLGETLKKPVGDYRKKIVDSVEEMEIILAHMIPEGIPYILSFIIIFIMIFITDYRLGLLSLVPIFINFIAMGVMQQNAKKFMKDYYAASKNMSANMVEYIGGIEVIKIFNRKDSHYQKLKDAIDKYRDFTLGWYDISYTPMAIGFAVGPTLTLCVLPFGLLMVQAGWIPLYKLIFACLLCFAGAAPLTRLTFFMAAYMNLSQRLKDLQSEFEAEPLETGNKTIDGIERIEYRDVRFSYEETEVIKGVSFIIEKNQSVAFVGESGSGKSTLVKLLMHYYDAQGGDILINGLSIKSLDLENLMDHIAYVSQDNFLFDTSIKDNLLIGKPNASDEEIVHACQQAKIHDVILNLEKGYDTSVGESGSKLSGGQKQRICIARAILKDADVIILDEATSFTDPENEYYIHEAVANLSKGKILISIAHKLSTIAQSDQIILLDEGRVVDVGTHHSLMENDIYLNLWNRFKGAKAFEFSVKGGEDQ